MDSWHDEKVGCKMTIPQAIAELEDRG